uniref:Glucose-fructose oxidoreductase domain-containing protein 2 n=1 Tax=Nannospalax galili TaxID=1026970 RepID=A0A8C6REN2_NANGA
MKMLPGVGVFGTGSSARVVVPLLRAEGFTAEALWGKTEEEAKQLAEEMNVTFYTSRTDDILLHQDVDPLGGMWCVRRQQHLWMLSGW